MLCTSTQAFLGLEKNESLNSPGHSKAVPWQAVVLPCYIEVEQRSAKAKLLIDLCSHSSQVKTREGKASWDESPGVESASGNLENCLLGEGMKE